MAIPSSRGRDRLVNPWSVLCALIPSHPRRPPLTRVHHTADGIRLHLAGSGTGPIDLTVDHVLAGSGYRIVLEAAPTYLDPALRTALTRTLPAHH
jgi:hypothetical protein